VGRGGGRQERPARKAKHCITPACGEARVIGSQVAHYLHYGIFLISVPNLIVICIMVAVFVLGVALRLPRHGGGD
jgi:hypothetical protein